MKNQTSLLFLFLLFFFAFNRVQAHPGDSCSNPIVLPAQSVSHYDSISAHTMRWYSIKANSSEMYIHVIDTLSDSGHVHTISIFSSCGGTSFTQISSNPITLDTLTLHATGLTPGSIYYIELSDTSVWCGRCSVSGHTKYSITVANTSFVGANFPTIFFNNTSPLCGLNYAYASIGLNGRVGPTSYDVQGINQPASMTMSGIPNGAIILNAYIVYGIINIDDRIGKYNSTFKFTVPGVGAPINSVTASVLGSAPGATCWQYANNDFIWFNNTYSYYVNVTSQVLLTPTWNGTGNYNGNYIIDGSFDCTHNTGGALNKYNPACPYTSALADADGATLVIIYQDPCASYQGTLTLVGGLNEPSSLPYTYNLSIPAVPSSVINENGIILTGDVENDKDTFGINYTPHHSSGGWVDGTYTFPPPLSLWSTQQQAPSPSYATGQTSVPFTLSTWTTSAPAFDCVDMFGMGAYYTYLPTNNICVTLTVAPSNTQLCFGGNVVLTANGPTGPTYTWSPSAGLSNTTGTSVTASPTVTTVYTVTINTGTGCAPLTATATVTVDPGLSASVSVASNVCAGVPVTPTVSGGTTPYTYTWNPGGATTATISTLSTGTYTVTVTDALGCSATTTTTFTVNPDCCYLSPSCGSPLTIPSGSSSASYTSADFTSNPCISISGPGTFTIPSGTFNISGCDIAMGDNATIDVASGATLVIDDSRLYACGDMWQGIKVENGGALYVNGTGSSSPCIIEDAIYGVYLKGSATISYGLLNNNLYDIYANGSGGYTGGLTLVSSKLSCQSDPGYSNNAYLKAPHLGAITNSGVYITNYSVPNGLVIGDNSSPSYQNTFNKMNYGVNANNASFAVQNNLFENLLGSSSPCLVSINSHTNCPPPVGIAVLANTLIGTQIEYLGGNWYYYAAVVTNNTMEQCYRGVDITNYSYPIITNNSLSNTTNTGVTSLYYGDHGIYLKILGNPEITDNTISNFATGIHINDFGFAAPNSINNIGNLTNNQITTTGGSTGVLTSGIIAENALTPAPYYLNSNMTYFPLSISTNTVTAASSACIKLSSSLPMYPLVSINSNTLQILPSTSKNTAVQRSGIYLAGSQNFQAYYNTISATGTYTITPAGKADTSVIGIRAVLSNKSTYECNSMTYVGECMMFEGPNFPSQVYYNYMDYAYNGFVMESSGEIGTQGGPTNPIGNVWNGNFSNDYTYTLNSFASSSELYVVNNATQNPTYSGNNDTYSNHTGDAYFYNYSVFAATGTVPTCPTGCTNCSYLSVRPQYRSFAQKIVDDSIPYSVFINESKYIGRQAVYEEISDDTMLMDSSTILHNFYTYTSGTGDTNNIGRLYNVNVDIAAGNYSAAGSLNSSIIPINLIEQNQQLVNYVYLSTVATGVDTATVADYDTLVNIATQCPVEGGNAVFEARGLLNLLFNTSLVITDSCLNDSSSGSSHAAYRKLASAIPSNINAKVYPNPANTMLNVQVNLTQGQIVYFTLYNSLGEEVKNMEVDNGLTTLPTNNLPAGMYYYRIIDEDGNTIKADKQLLIH